MKKRFFIFIMPIIFLQFLLPSQAKTINEDEKLIAIGVGAFNDGFYEIAERQFSQFIKEFPNHPKSYDIYYLLGKTLFITKKLKEAKLIFKKILEEGKNFHFSDYSLFWSALIDMRLGNNEEAKRLFYTLSKKYPKFDWLDYSHYLIGILEFESNRFSHAETSFKMVIQHSKHNELVKYSLFWLGIISYRKNAYEAAVNYIQPLLKDLKGIPQIYQKYAIFILSESQLKLGRYHEAKINYKVYLERYKDDLFIPQVFWKLGFCEYRLGNIKESIEIFQSFKNNFKNSPLLPYTNFLLGIIFLIKGDYESSIKEINLILNKPQEHPLWGLALLCVYWDFILKNDLPEANRTFQKLQKLNHFEDEKIFIQWLHAEMIFNEGKISDSLPYYFNILNTKFRERTLFQIAKGNFFEKKFRESITNLDILLLEFPNSKYVDEALFIKAENLMQLGYLDQALTAYDSVFKRNKNDIWQLLSLAQAGRIHLLKSENEKAEKIYKKIINYFTNHPLFYHAAYQLGNLYFKLKRFPEALQFYSIILTGNRPDLLGETHFRMGEILYQEGRLEKALGHFQKAIEYFKEGSTEFFLTQLEIGNLYRRWDKYEEAKRYYMIVLTQSKDEEIKEGARILIQLIESIKGK